MTWGKAVRGIVVGGTVAALLAACGSTVAGDKPRQTSATDGTTTPTGSNRSLPAPKAVPSGYRWLHSDRAGLDLAVPSQWESMDPSELTGDDAAVKKYADRVGLTVDQLRQSVAAGLEALLRGPQSWDEIRLLVFDQALNPGGFQKTLEAGGATAVKIEPYPSPTGFNVIAGFDIDTPTGPMSCRSMMLMLKNPSGRTALIQVCSEDAQTTEDLATTVFQGTRFS